MKHTDVRLATEADVAAIHDVFARVYGDDYPYKDFLNDDWLRRSIFNDDILTVVAEDRDTRQLLGTASVVSDIGAQSDLLGEFGRLAVVPEAKGRGVGKALMAKRLELSQKRLHVALVENRSVHEFSQRISQRAGFVPVGLLPLKHQFAGRESMALYAKHFGGALSMRRNHPHVVPEAHELAFMASQNCGLDFDGIVDETAAAYPEDGDFEVETLSEDDYAVLLRIERGRVSNREVFGPLRLHYGFFKLGTKRASYLVARRPTRGGHASPIAGAIGFLRDDTERTLRVFELIALSDQAISFLFDRLLEQCRRDWQTAYVEVDVNAHSPRLQRTLVERGFVVAAYVPAMVFCDVERIDVLKMTRLFATSDYHELRLVKAADAVAGTVLSQLSTQSVLPELADALRGHAIFAGLNPEQVSRVAAVCELESRQPGATLFAEGDPAEALYIVTRGELQVSRDSAGQDSVGQDTLPHPIGSVSRGEVVGEHSFLTEDARSATVTAVSNVQVATLTRTRWLELSRRRPDVALALYRNLSIGLGRKLRRAGDAVAIDRT